MSLEEEDIKESTFKEVISKMVKENMKGINYMVGNLDYYLGSEIRSAIRLIELKARQHEIPKSQIDNNFQLEITKTLNHITLILEDFLNTNKEILNKLDNLRNENLDINKVEEEEILAEIQDLPEEIIETIIIDYLNKKGKNKVYPSDIAIAFNLDAKKVFDICQKLKSEGNLV